MPFGETVAVIDKSGKVVNTSKQVFGIFNNARNAYRERKSQFQYERNAKVAERQAMKAMENFSFDDGQSVASSRRSGRSRSVARRPSGRSQHPRRASSRAPSHYSDEESVYAPPPAALPRRHTQPIMNTRDVPQQRPPTGRTMSDADVDMDLAYGDYNPEAMVPRNPGPPGAVPANNMQLQKIEDPELNSLVNRAQILLEEAECLHYSATTAMSQLQQHPDAMAAVALTLAEISNLIGKMAPAAISMLKTSAPAVWALLASPQFLIAAGVGIGATIVMFGSYKIIKQIGGGGSTENKPKAVEEPERPEELMEINTECLSQVEMWRRGVADVEAKSTGTKVDGEFITHTAATMSGIDVNNARNTRDPRFKFDDDAATVSSRRTGRSRSVHTPRRESKSKPPTTSIFSKMRSSSKPPPPAKSPSKAPPPKAPSKVPTTPMKTPSKAPSPSKTPSKTPSKAPPPSTPSKTPSKPAFTRSYSKHDGLSERDSKQAKDTPKRSSKLRLMFTSSS
ncbi:uncharacterized protein ASPGLDRAFT_65136 [Aspergillus glaucus CBS 516.65]|uniref:Uncharacterized protein n=1 Tax=Aspergillus glaucus CBS 516.65 TaxID=1160497 RepID=A0A1L9VPV8_ASPGL|nr:hypothetical protein ASPGLDRAFT_65136 [Aspergillus glaucus CBS 516.65]OJJ85949.1 hypothetical protein ASPGLDRAFT_65136 [Aspergillus glaucus CBS 516.65]